MDATSKDPVSSLRAITARDVRKGTNGKICDGCRGGWVRDSGLLLGLAGTSMVASSGGDGIRIADPRMLLRLNAGRVVKHTGSDDSGGRKTVQGNLTRRSSYGKSASAV